MHYASERRNEVRCLCGGGEIVGWGVLSSTLACIRKKLYLSIELIPSGRGHPDLQNKLFLVTPFQGVMHT